MVAEVLVARSQCTPRGACQHTSAATSCSGLCELELPVSGSFRLCSPVSSRLASWIPSPSGGAGLSWAVDSHIHPRLLTSGFCLHHREKYFSHIMNEMSTLMLCSI